MRIYEGSPRQDWEDVLRAVGSLVDRERLKELLLLELEGGVLLQGLTLAAESRGSEGSGTLTKRTYELTDEQLAQLLEEAIGRRGTVEGETSDSNIAHFYENALRVVGRWVDSTKARDLFFFEQEGAFVLRMLVMAAGGAAGHHLVEFTRDEIVAMIGDAPALRLEGAAADAPTPGGPAS